MSDIPTLEQLIDRQQKVVHGLQETVLKFIAGKPPVGGGKDVVLSLATAIDKLSSLLMTKWQIEKN